MLHVGIDLHGTLITDHPEEVSAQALPRLLEAMKALHHRVRLYACTGNDLGFLRRKLPVELLSLLDGAVLETGCVGSDLETETVLVDAQRLATIRALEADRGRGISPGFTSLPDGWRRSACSLGWDCERRISGTRCRRR